MSAADTAGQERLTVRISTDQRELLERAAIIAGQPLDEFVTSELLRSARQVIQEYAVIRISAKGWEELGDLLEADDRPNESLRGAAERNPDVRPVASPPSA